MQNKQKWWVYINGYRVAETKSIGYKWVYYRTSKYSRYKRIKRSEWDKACLSTLAEQQEKLDIRKKARELGICNTKKSRKKYGWTYKTFDEIKLEVLSYV
tara:strand:- start:482 stop:781 length:300 start_codon:yes stop_codon:yes gene_type:complete